MELKSILLVTAMGIAAACSGTGASYEPVLAATPTDSYQQDLEDCRTLARNEGLMNPETRTKAVIGLATGAIAGAADDNAGAGALVGAVTGTVVGASDTRFERKKILVECLKQRGQPIAG